MNASYLEEYEKLANELPTVKLEDYKPAEDKFVSPPAVKHKPIDPSLLPAVSEDIEKKSKEFANTVVNRVTNDNSEFEYI